MAIAPLLTSRRVDYRVPLTSVLTYLDSSFATGQTTRLCAALDLFLVTTSREHSLVTLRRQLVSHGIELRAHVAHHGLSGLRMGWVRIVLRHTVWWWWWEWRAHGLLLGWLRLRLWLLAVLQTDWRQVEGRQRHV